MCACDVGVLYVRSKYTYVRCGGRPQKAPQSQIQSHNNNGDLRNLPPAGQQVIKDRHTWRFGCICVFCVLFNFSSRRDTVSSWRHLAYTTAAVRGSLFGQFKALLTHIWRAAIFTNTASPKGHNYTRPSSSTVEPLYYLIFSSSRIK